MPGKVSVWMGDRLQVGNLFRYATSHPGAGKNGPGKNGPGKNGPGKNGPEKKVR